MNLIILYVCHNCNKEKEIIEFHKDKTQKNGFKTACRECRSFQAKIKRFKNNTLKQKIKLQKSDIEILQIKNKKRIYNTNYQRERYNKDSIYKIKNNLRSRFKMALKSTRGGSAIRDLDCSIPELKQWLEQQFKEGMTWGNHGEWHIDHIIPMSKFDLSDPKQVKKACHWFNLQPLWAEENLKKSDKYYE